VTHRGSIGALIDSSGNTVVSDVAKAGMFNEHFAEVGIIDNGVTPTPALYTEFFWKLFHSPILIYCKPSQNSS